MPAKFKDCPVGANNCPQDSQGVKFPILDSLYVFDCYGEQKASLSNGDLVNVNSLTHQKDSDDLERLQREVAADPLVQSQVVKKYCEKLMESEVVYCLGQFDYPVKMDDSTGEEIYHPQSKEDSIHSGTGTDTSKEFDNIKLMVPDEVITARNAHSVIARKETYNPPNPTLE